MGRTIQSRLREKRPPAPSLQGRRLSTAQRGYGADWQVLRAEHLRAHPWCVRCGKRGTHVDHVQPHKGDEGKRMDKANLQTQCHSCHSRKTASNDGGFGNKVK